MSKKSRAARSSIGFERELLEALEMSHETDVCEAETNDCEVCALIKKVNRKIGKK